MKRSPTSQLEEARAIALELSAPRRLETELRAVLGCAARPRWSTRRRTSAELRTVGRCHQKERHIHVALYSSEAKKHKELEELVLLAHPVRAEGHEVRVHEPRMATLVEAGGRHETTSLVVQESY